MPVFPSPALLGIFAFNSLTAPTAFYIYAQGISEGEMARLIGYRDKTGALVDGALTNFFQAVGASNNGIDVTTAVLQIDADANSPFAGYVRLSLTMAATAA
jgi:hypothetical protein